MIGLALGDGCRGHNGKVRSLAWAGNDAHIISCGTEGAVYQWKVKTSKRVRENVLKVRTSPKQPTTQAEAATRLDLVSACWAPHKAQHSAASFVRHVPHATA